MPDATRFPSVIEELLRDVSSIEGELCPDDSVIAIRKFYTYLKCNPPLAELAMLQDLVVLYIDESNQALGNSLSFSLAEYLEVNKEQIISDLKSMSPVDQELSLLFLIRLGSSCQNSFELTSEILTRSTDLIDLTFPPDRKSSDLVCWMRAYFMILAVRTPFDRELRNNCEVSCRETILKLREEHLECKDSTLLAETFLMFVTGTIDEVVCHNFFCYLVTPQSDYGQLISAEECQSLFESWRTSSSKDQLVANVSAHLRAMIELEELHPGSTSELRVLYGIQSFARYDPVVLIDQLQYTEPGVSSVFLVNTLSDHTDSFLEWKDQHSALATQVSDHESQLIVVEVGSIQEIAERIKLFASGNEPYIQSMMIASHGNSDGLSINISNEVGNRELWNSQLREGCIAAELFRKIGSYVYDGGELVLLACEAAQGAKLISKLIPHAYISAFRRTDNAEFISYQEDYFHYESTYNKRNGLVIYYQGQIFDPE